MSNESYPLLREYYPAEQSNRAPTFNQIKRLGELWLGKQKGKPFGSSENSNFYPIFGYIIAVVIVILDILSAAGILVSGNKNAQTGIGSVNIILYTGIFITIIVFWILGYQALEVNSIFNVVFMSILFITSLIFMSASIAQYRANPEKHPADTGELVMGVFNLVLIIVFLIIAIYKLINVSEGQSQIGYPFLTLFPLFKLITAIISITRANITRTNMTQTTNIPETPKEPPSKEPQKEPITLQPPSKEPEKQPPTTQKPPSKEPEKEPTKEPPSVKPTSSYRGRTPPRPKSPGVPVEPVGIEQSVKKERERLLSPKI